MFELTQVLKAILWHRLWEDIIVSIDGVFELIDWTVWINLDRSVWVGTTESVKKVINQPHPLTHHGWSCFQPQLEKVEDYEQGWCQSRWALLRLKYSPAIQSKLGVEQELSARSICRFWFQGTSSKEESSRSTPCFRSCSECGVGTSSVDQQTQRQRRRKILLASGRWERCCSPWKVSNCLGPWCLSVLPCVLACASPWSVADKPEPTFWAKLSPWDPLK